MNHTEVLTLEEVATYLKLPLETVAREADQGHLPGRRIAVVGAIVAVSVAVAAPVPIAPAPLRPTPTPAPTAPIPA